MERRPIDTAQAKAPARAPNLARQRDLVLTVLGWLVIVGVVLWAASHIISSLLVLLVAALLAYALAPGVMLLARFLPRFLALIIVYVLVVGAIGGLIYLIASTAVAQITTLAHTASQLTQPGSHNPLSQLLPTLRRFGVTDSQIQTARQQLINQAQGLAQDVIPLLQGIFNAVLDTILVTVLSVYLLIDGQRVITWLRTNAPRSYRSRVVFSLETVERVVGGYIRGQLALCTLVGVLVGAGMALFQIPYALLLGILAFIFEFIPILGVFFSGALCVILALVGRGPIWALIVLVYFIVVHIIEGDVVGPRIVGRAVGVHPAVSIFALLAGAELFGVWGALLASPVAGITQVIIVALWRQWRRTHSGEFVAEDAAVIVPVTTAEALEIG